MKHFVNRILIYVCPEGTEGIYFPGPQRGGGEDMNQQVERGRLVRI